MACKHDHGDDHLQAFVCDVAQQIRSATGDLQVGIVVIAPDGTAKVATWGNDAAFAAMAAAICGISIKDPRPTDCKACGEAHDRMNQALVLLRQIEGRCQ